MYSIYKSTDGGINWAPAAGVLHKRLVGTLVSDPNNEQSLIVGTNEGAFRTADGGASWTTLQMYPAQASGPVSSIAIDPLDSRINPYFGDLGETGRVFRSVDGGATFQNLMTDYYIGGPAVSLLIRTEQPDRIIASLEGNGVREFSISPDLQVTAGPNGSVAAGAPASFTFTVTNRVPFDATSIRLQAQLDGVATGTSATSSNGSCTVVASSITCNADVLRKDATMTVNLVGTMPASGTLRADATVSARQPDSVTTNNSASSTLTVTGASVPTPGGGGNGGGGVVSGFLLWVPALPRLQKCLGLHRTSHAAVRRRELLITGLAVFEPAGPANPLRQIRQHLRGRSGRRFAITTRHSGAAERPMHRYLNPATWPANERRRRARRERSGSAMPSRSNYPATRRDTPRSRGRGTPARR